MMHLVSVRACAVTDADLQSLARDTALRPARKQAFRPSTTANHTRQLISYLSFLSALWPPRRPAVNFDIVHVQCIEFLARSFASPRSIKWRALDAPCNRPGGSQLGQLRIGPDFPSFGYYNGACAYPSLPHYRIYVVLVVFSLRLLGHLRTVVLKFAFLFGFFSFVRQSNLTPVSPTSFDPHRHTCRRDVYVHPHGLVVAVKVVLNSPNSPEDAPDSSSSDPPPPFLPSEGRGPTKACSYACPSDPLLSIPTADDASRPPITTQLRRAFSIPCWSVCGWTRLPIAFTHFAETAPLLLTERVQTSPVYSSTAPGRATPSGITSFLMPLTTPHTWPRPWRLV